MTRRPRGHGRTRCSVWWGASRLLRMSYWNYRTAAGPIGGVPSWAGAASVLGSAGLGEERLDVRGELDVMLEEKPVGRVRIDGETGIREQPCQQVRVAGQDHGVAVAVGDEDREPDRRDSLELGVIWDSPGAHGVVLCLASLPGRRFVPVR